MKKQFIFLIAALFLITIWVVWAMHQRDELESKHLFTEGIITDCRWGGRGDAFYNVNCYFILNTKKYSSSCSLSCKDFNVDTLRKRLMGLHVPVIYNPDKPWVNTIVIEKEAFKRYNLPIPDSLVAVTNFLDCK